MARRGIAAGARGDADLPLDDGPRAVTDRRPVAASSYCWSAAVTPAMNEFAANVSVQRKTATMSLAGSIQVRLPPLPRPKMLSGDAPAKLPRRVFSHHMKP